MTRDKQNFYVVDERASSSLVRLTSMADDNRLTGLELKIIRLTKVSK